MQFKHCVFPNQINSIFDVTVITSITTSNIYPMNSNTILIYIYMFILLYANCVVLYCVSFYVVVGNKLYLILSYLILSYELTKNQSRFIAALLK